MGDLGRPLLGLVGAGIGFAIPGIGPSLGFAIGSLVGALLFPAPKQVVKQSGPKLSDISVTKTGFGQGIPILHGADRLASIPIFKTKIKEVVTLTIEEQGKGGGGIETQTTTYEYFMTDSRIFCEGPIINYRKLWADGKLIYDASATNLGVLSKYINSLHFYKGEEDQVPNPSITAIVGVDESEANRGQAKVDFIRFPLKNFGNRPPGITAEVVNSDGVAVHTTHLHWYGFSFFDRKLFSYNEYYYIHVVDEIVPWNSSGTYGAIGIFNGITGEEISRSAHEQMHWIDYWSSGHPFTGGAVLSRDGRSLYCKSWRSTRDNRADPVTGGSMISRYDLYTGEFYFEGDALLPLDGSIAGGHVAQIILDNGDIVNSDEHAAFTMGINSTIDPQTGLIENEFMAVLEDIDSGTHAGTRVHIVKIDPVNLDSPITGGTGVDRILPIEVDEGYDTFQIYMYPLKNGNLVQRWSIFPVYNDFDDIAIATYGYNFTSDAFFKFSDVSGLAQRWRDITGFTSFNNMAFNIVCSDYFTNTLIVDITISGSGFNVLVKADVETFEPLEVLSWNELTSYTRTGNPQHLRPIQGQVDDGFVWCTFFGSANPSGNQYWAFLIDIEAWIVTRVIPLETSNTFSGDTIREEFDNELTLPWHYHPLTHSVVGETSKSGDFISINDISLSGHEGDWYDNDDVFITERMTSLEKEIWSDTVGLHHAAREYLDRVGSPTGVTLQSVVDDTVERVEPDVLKNTNDLIPSVTGYSIRNRGTARGALEVLAEPYQYTLIESNWQVYGVLRSNPDKRWYIPEEHLGVRQNDSPDSQITENFVGELDLPKRIEAVYRTPARDYDTNMQSANFPTGVATTQDIEVLEWNIVFNDDEAIEYVHNVRDLAYASQDSYELTLPLRYIGINPNDEIVASWDGQTVLMYVNEVSIGTNQVVIVKATRTDSEAFLQTVVGASADDSQVLPDLTTAPTIFYYMDTTLFRDQDATTYGPYAAISSQFSLSTGAAVYEVLPSGELAIVGAFTDTQVSTAGFTRTALPDTDDLYILDTVNTVDVRLLHPDMFLSSITEEQALNETANIFMIGQEVVIAQTVEQLSDLDWRLSDFRRAERGTEWATSTHTTGENFVLIEEDKLIRIDLTTSDLNVEKVYKIVTTGAPFEQAVTAVETWTGNDLKPWSVVHVETSYATDLTISWTRRTRYGGGLNDYADIPLNEETETYEIDILDAPDGTVLNTYSVTDVSAFVYTVAQYNADFGTSLSEVGDVDFCIYQISATVGRGFVTCSSAIATSGPAAGVETPQAGQLLLSSVQPTLDVAASGGTPPQGNLVLSGQIPTVLTPQDIEIPQGNLSLEEDKVPTVEDTKLITPPAGDVFFE